MSRARLTSRVFARDPLAEPELLIDRVYGYVAYRIGDGPDAEDVTSDVFERALRYRHTYDPSRGEPITWLLGIARRCIDRFASQLPTARYEPPETAAPGDLEEEAVGRLMFLAALSGLEPRDRELLGLRYGADLSAGQIAELLNLRTNTVEVALHRALGRLRADSARPSADEAAAATSAV